MDSESSNSHLANFVDGVLELCDVSEASDMAPRDSIAGTSTVSTLNEKVQVEVLFLDDLIAPHARGVFPRNSVLLPVQSKYPQKVWDIFCEG